MPLLAGQRVVVLDFETTGWEPERAAIVEIGRVTLDGGAITDEWSSLVRPGRPMPPDAARVHGITDAMVADAPPPGALAPAVRDACAGATIALHNASFDLPFLIGLMRAAAAPPLLNPVVDTLGLARGLFGSGGNALGPLAERFGIAHDGPHRALPDARATAELLRALAERWERERGIRSLDELAGASQDALRVSVRRGLPVSAPAPLAG
jgi:DNA polymerase III epsilon subunit family exonuclease